MSNLVISLWISLIGGLLIFVAIFILWGFMELLVRITTPRQKAVEEVPAETRESTLPVAAVSDHKRLAAVAAVATALALQKSGTSLSAAPQSAELSAWQVAPLQK